MNRSCLIAAKRKTPGFKTVLWALVIFASLWSVGGPLLENTWAQWRWRETPCYLSPEGGFYYRVGDTHYVSSHINFWTGLYHTDPIAPDAISVNHPHNAVCWVSPGDPTQSVLRLDAWHHFGEAGGRFACAGLLIGAALVITVLGDRKRKR